MSRKLFIFIVAPLLLTELSVLIMPLPKFDSPASTIVLDRHGELLGATIAQDEQWRFPQIDEVPEKYKIAAITFEDRRFFHHPGVDILALARALRDNLRQGAIVSGASTITMQVIRLSRPAARRTIGEKLIEMLMALRLEIASSKAEILKIYASHAPYGGNVVGLEAAAWRYFGRDPHHLSWAETATLAVLPNSPALIHPGRRRDLLREKRNRLLFSLYERGSIDSLTFTLSLQEPLPEKPKSLPMRAPHLLIRLCQEPENAENKFITTLQASQQKRVTGILERHAKHLALKNIHNAAALVLNIDSGEVLAYVGNVETSAPGANGQYVDIITSPRSTGSILKPLLYATMLETGELLPTALVPDIPTQMGGFAPENYSRTYEGAVPAYMALARSLNVPAVRILDDYGVHRFHAFLQNLGMTTLFRPAQDYGLSLILGGAEGTLWELTAIYAGLARTVKGADMKNENPFRKPTFVLGDKKSVIRSASPLSAASCWLTLQAMLDVTRPQEDQAWRAFQSSQKIAWKTGTSYGFRDAWAIGVTPKYAVGVWVGNADGEGRPGLTGLSAAAPILFDIFNALEPSPWFEPPEAHLYEIKVCAQSGYRAGPFCARTRTVKAPEAGLSFGACPYCRLVHCDSTRSWRVHADCEQIANIHAVSWFNLPPTVEWFYRKKHSDYQPLPPFRDDCYASLATIGSTSMNLIHHNLDRQIYVPIELDGSVGRIVFQATHRQPDITIYWHLDEKFITATRGIHQIAIAPKAGEHLLTLVDETGETLQRTFTVLEK
jgi:penicillin-binding protein 1C